VSKREEFSQLKMSDKKNVNVNLSSCSSIPLYFSNNIPSGLLGALNMCKTCVQKGG